MKLVRVNKKKVNTPTEAPVAANREPRKCSITIWMCCSGLQGAVCVPHTHHCGGGVTRVLTQGTANHALSHLVVQNGATDAAVVETRLTAADGGTFDELSRTNS